MNLHLIAVSEYFIFFLQQRSKRQITRLLYFSKHDIIVTKLTGQVKPRKNPQTYSSNDIKKGIEGLYVAIQRPRAPTEDEEVVIGYDIKERRSKDASCESTI